jgi:hypothetical protein
MESLLNSIRKSLQEENWYGALVLALIIPDICGKLEEPSLGSQARYAAWFETYLGQKYRGFLSGNDCYALRCSYLHEGSDNVEGQRASEAVDHFFFKTNGSHRVKISNSTVGDTRYDNKDLLQLSAFKFCNDIVDGAEAWLLALAVNQDVQDRLSKLLVIHEQPVNIGRMIRIN